MALAGGHPEWSEGAHWPPEVSSCALDDGYHLLLFDPLAVLLELPVELVLPAHDGANGARARARLSESRAARRAGGRLVDRHEDERWGP